ncbi:unnamed protein product, partial [Meganyctiphanes norvegica]
MSHWTLYILLLLLILQVSTLKTTKQKQDFNNKVIKKYVENNYFKPPTIKKVSALKTTKQKQGFKSKVSALKPLKQKPGMAHKPLKKKPLKKKASCECGISNSNTDRIIGGQPVPRRKYPWLVFVHGRKLSCTGSLISSRHVISAAHCVHTGTKWMSRKGWKVTIGDHNLNEATDNINGETKTVSAKVIRHPKYNPKNADHDIILLKLKKPLKLKKFNVVRPICLPSSSYKNYINVDAICAGWGDTSAIQTTLTEVPHEITLKTENDQCRGYPVTQNMICTKALWKKKTPYLGDSGGPLMVNENGRYVQIGVVSHGQTEKDVKGNKAVAVFTKVTQVLPWIKNKIKKDVICK